jgi:hypothetical protein
MFLRSLGRAGTALTCADDDDVIRIIHGSSCVMVTPMADRCLFRCPNSDGRDSGSVKTSNEHGKCVHRRIQGRLITPLQRLTDKHTN